MVPAVSDDDPALRVKRHAEGVAELLIALPQTAKGTNERSTVVKRLHRFVSM